MFPFPSEPDRLWRRTRGNDGGDAPVEVVRGPVDWSERHVCFNVVLELLDVPAVSASTAALSLIPHQRAYLLPNQCDLLSMPLGYEGRIHEFVTNHEADAVVRDG